MLEDSADREIVHWVEGGEAFVILDQTLFEQRVLHKYFKHSNFSSFVRQLNKYDFHKVPQKGGENYPFPNHPNASIFTHSIFRENQTDLLPYIQRKQPGPRRTQSNSEDWALLQELISLGLQLEISQARLYQLSKAFIELLARYTELKEKVLKLQESVRTQGQMMQRLLENINPQGGYSQLDGDMDFVNEDTPCDGQYAHQSVPEDELETSVNYALPPNDFSMLQHDSFIAPLPPSNELGDSSGNSARNWSYSWQ
ncbi:Transcription factor [Erysiphe necator]|nr:Transcription factor [Erysiphe necator]